MTEASSPAVVKPASRVSKGLVLTIIGYAPANIIPVLATIATIVVFTRLLPPRELGYYAMAQACFAFGQVVAFSSLQLAVTRFSRAGQPDQASWIATAYRGYFLCVIATAILFVPAIMVIVRDPELRYILWLCFAALLLRGGVMINLAIHRRLLHTMHYNIIECGQPVVAFFVALILVTQTGMGAAALLWGMLVAAAIALLADLPLLLQARGPADKALFADMGRYGAPLGLTYALSSFSAYADRGFLLEFVGTAALGVYGIAFNLVDRATSLIFNSINIGAFPMALAALDREGPAAARQQMLRTGALLLTLAVPAAVGLACCSATAAYVIVGEQYRVAVAAIMPWLSLASIVRGLSVHFFEHAFHLGRKTNLSLMALIPVACINLVLNALLIPSWGINGALIAATVTQIAGLAFNIIIGRRVFRLDFPFLHALRAVAAVIPMGAVVLLLPVYHNVFGLIFKITAGAVTYGAVGFLVGLLRPYDQLHAEQDAAAAR